MKKILPLLVLCLLFVSTTAPIALADKRTPIGTEEANRLVMRTDYITAVFEGKKPKVTFYITNTTGKSPEYKINFKRLIEFNDTNNNKVFEKPEQLAWAELESADWDHTAFYNLTESTKGKIGIAINFTLSSPINIEKKGDSPTKTNLSLKLVVKLYQYNITDVKKVGASTYTYSVIGGVEVKVDVIIANWTFGIESSPYLALEMNLHSNHNRFEIEERTQRRVVNGNQTESETRKMEQTNATEQKMRYLNATGYVVGFFKFVNYARIVAGTIVYTVNVTASYISEPEVGENQVKLFMCYPKWLTGILYHDPSFGVSEPVTPTAEVTIPEFLVSSAIVLIITIAIAISILRVVKVHKRLVN